MYVVLTLIQTEEVFAELRKLNDAYETKFGFKFVVFVNGRQKREIIPVLGERLEREREAELDLGLTEMMKIAYDRLKKLEKYSFGLHSAL